MSRKMVDGGQNIFFEKGEIIFFSLTVGVSGGYYIYRFCAERAMMRQVRRSAATTEASGIRHTESGQATVGIDSRRVPEAPRLESRHQNCPLHKAE